jgi:mycothiol S-conjugate amidase
VHEVSLEAFHAAGDPDRYPELGEPWQPLKLYYTLWSRARFEETHKRFLALGLESPFDKKWFDRPSQDDRITTRVNISDFMEVRSAALLAHRTQIDPTSPFWFGLPAEEARTVHPWEEYQLAHSLVDSPLPEDDVFAGVRDRVGG